VVRGLQSCGAPAGRVAGPARVAVNLRGVDRDAVSRGHRLSTPGAVLPGRVLEVAVRWAAPGRVPRQVTLHLGTASRPVSVAARPDGTARVRLRAQDAALPLAVGDRGLLRDPGRHLVLAGVEVLEVVAQPGRADPRSARTDTHADAHADAEPARGEAHAEAVTRLRRWLEANPGGAPTAADLRVLALGPADLAAAERAGAAVLLHGAVVAPRTMDRVRDALGALPGPATVGEVCRAVGAPRRVVVPVLERLDATHVTRRLPDGRRVVRRPSP
jgi:selenocysteine-specific elongation factor